MDVGSYCFLSSDCSSLSCISSSVKVGTTFVAIDLQGTISVCDGTIALSGSADNIFLDNSIDSTTSFNSVSGDGITFNVYLTQTSSTMSLSMSFTDSSDGSETTLFDSVSIPKEELCSCSISDRSKNYSTTQTLVHVFAILAGLFSCFFGEWSNNFLDS